MFSVPAEGRVQSKTEMSLAAGIVRRVEGRREHGPARVQAAHAQHAQAGPDARGRGRVDSRLSVCPSPDSSQMGVHVRYADPPLTRIVGYIRYVGCPRPLHPLQS